MSDRPPMPEVDRREFLNGRWPTRVEERPTAAAEIASVLVQIRPERVDEVAGVIAALPGVDIYSRSPQGKLVAVIEAADVGAVGTTLHTISSLPHVLTAALVFHGTDEG